MPSEELSAVQAILDDKAFQRDVAIVTLRFPTWSQFEAVMLTIQIHNHVALNMWAPDDEEKEDPPPPGWNPNDPDNTGWRP